MEVVLFIGYTVKEVINSSRMLVFIPF